MRFLALGYRLPPLTSVSRTKLHGLRAFSSTASRRTGPTTTIRGQQVESEPTKNHFTVGADGKIKVKEPFFEEPLGLPWKDGYGWPQLDFGESVGPGGRYVICRKLGWGGYSSTWLARDQEQNRYVALKVLTGWANELMKRGNTWEHEALRRISNPPPSPHCLHLLFEFTIPGRGSSGDHTCFVTELFAGDINTLSKRYRFPFPLSICKRILYHTLCGISHFHSRGVVHTDLKPDNILVSCALDTEGIDRLLESQPSRKHFPEESYDGIVQSAVSQPLPMPSLQEAASRTFVVADFGNAQPIGKHLTDFITPPGLRPPEIVIGGPWNEKVDIWTFGCLIFEIITTDPLFVYAPSNIHHLDEDSFLLYQMMCFTCEEFSAQQLVASEDAPKFFGHDRNLKQRPPLMAVPVEQCLKEHRTERSLSISDEDINAIGAIMRRCLHLDPMQRASAAELLSDPFFYGVE
ncbi:kinase-like protein [Panus rudis PR-1116 ss-1]|nr:kinase-like protein [Panus rudis PR-1116 ss-1]